VFWLKSRNKFMSAILIVTAVGLAGLIMPQEWYDRMGTVKTYEQDASAMGRINAWWTSFNVAADRITGGGFEMLRPGVYRKYAPEPDRIHDVHSIYFEVLGEHGFIGLAMFLLLGIFSWMTLARVIRQSRKDPELRWMYDLATMTQVSMLGYATAGTFLGLAYFDYIYHLVVIAVILGTLAGKQKPLPAEAAFPRFGGKPA
jgi:probable O-glycosylation ligase (exosortase A-associated)